MLKEHQPMHNFEIIFCGKYLGINSNECANANAFNGNVNYFMKTKFFPVTIPL